MFTLFSDFRSTKPLSGLVNITILMVIGFAGAANTLAAPGGGNNVKEPATPYLDSPVVIARGASNVTLDVGGISNGGRVYQNAISGFAGASIQASFELAGSADNTITVNSISVTSDTSLRLNVSIDSLATIGGRTLTVTNPDGQSATSTVDIITVIIDPPSIVSASITPDPVVCTTNDLAVSITEVTNIDGAVITYTYEWYEGSALISTSAVLPADLTTGGASYLCKVTPFKGDIQGSTFTTTAVTCAIDKDGNKLNDEWELEYFGATNIDPLLDSDGDGLANRAEFLFGLSPVDSKSCSVITQALDPITGEFSYTRPANEIAGVSYEVWVSPDLVNWTKQTVVTETATNNNGKSKTIIASIGSQATANKSQLFVRVSATF